MNMKFLLFVLVCCMLTMTACATDRESALQTTPTTTVQNDDSYPAPNTDYYPPPQTSNTTISAEITQEDIELPIPQDGLTTIGGIIIDEKTNQAPIESIVYLGEVVYTDTGVPIVRMSQQSAPFVVLPLSGEFIFKDIPPGEYSLVFFTPDYSFLIDNAETDESLLLSVTSNQTLNLGKLEIQTP